MKKLLVSLFITLLIVGNANADTLTLSGPTLSRNIGGWASSGLQFTALEDVVLEQFVFNNQSKPDTIQLKDSEGNVLETYTYSGGEPAHLVIVNWSLQAGMTYSLIAEVDSNGRYEYYANYPTSNEHIQIDGVINAFGDLSQTFWFHFTDIQTSFDMCCQQGPPGPPGLAGADGAVGPPGITPEEIEALQNQMNDLEKKIEKLEKEIKKLKKKKKKK